MLKVLGNCSAILGQNFTGLEGHVTKPRQAQILDGYLRKNGKYMEGCMSVIGSADFIVFHIM